MQNFFDPNEHAEIFIPMYGTIHFLTFAVMLAFIPLFIWKKEAVKRLVENRRFMVNLASIFLMIEAIYWILLWHFDYTPYYDRFPFHLCGTLALLLPILILTKRYDGIRYFTFWGVGAGFISLVNPSFIHDHPWSFVFLNYLTRHYFIFLLPIFLFIGLGYSFRYSTFLKSMIGLIGYAFIIFLANWAFDTNYMHLGKNNPLPVPFLPESYAVWPWTYPSFVIVGIILFHIIFLVFYISRRGMQSFNPENQGKYIGLYKEK